MSNLNPYPVGSDDWHRFNLGVTQGVIGQILDFKIDDHGVEVEFLLYDDDEYICELGEDCPFREDDS